MGADSKIEWTHHTFNPWIGCAHVHAGCLHCYAEAFAKRYGKAKWGANGTRVRTSKSYWRQPIKWNLEAGYSQERRRVFCASLADIFEDWKGPIHGSGRDDGELAIDDERSRLLTMDDCRRDLFALIDQTPWLDWLVLTKRPENVRRMWDYSRKLKTSRVRQNEGDNIDVFRRNVRLGTSVSDQATYDAMLPQLLPSWDLCPLLFLSIEPLLGPIDLGLNRIWCRHHRRFEGTTEGGNLGCMDESLPCFRWGAELCDMIPWVIVGGESGQGSRPCNLAWIRSIRDQCQAAGVACFIKQLGNKPVAEGASRGEYRELDHVRQLWKIRDPKGGDWSEWAEDLRVRQFPAVQVAS